MIKFLFDTNALNQIVKEGIETDALNPSHEYFITSLQKDELASTRNKEVKEKLLHGLKTMEINIPIKNTSLETAIWDKFYWGEMYWGQEGGHYDRLLRKLNECPRKRNDRGNVTDALLIEVCIIQGHTLVSNDSCIQSISNDEGIDCLNLNTFLSRYGPK